MPKPHTIKTVADLFTHLGTLSEAAEFFGITPQKAWNWKASKRIPPQHYLDHKAKLDARGITVSDAVWFGTPVKQRVAS